MSFQGSVQAVVRVMWKAMARRILYKLKAPNLPVLEPIGETGDTITGLVSGFAYAGYKLIEAVVMAIKTNRTAGKLVIPTPATPVRKIIDKFPEVFAQYIDAWKEELPGENHPSRRFTGSSSRVGVNIIL